MAMAMILGEGFLLSSVGVLLMILFEFGLSSDDVQRFRNRDGGKELHAAGLFATIFNHLVFVSRGAFFACFLFTLMYMKSLIASLAGSHYILSDRKVWIHSTT